MGRKMKYRCGIWTVLFFLWTASAMTGCARREEVFLEELDSDEENSNRKAGEESTAYENNVAAGENPKKQSAVSDAGSEGNTENSALDLPLETPIPQKIFVDVCGAVVNPGVYELDEGARIFQAVDAAGGYLPEAAINNLNRARSIGDGQQIYVPTEKEVAENLELAMAKVPEALNDGDNSGNLGLEEIQGSSVENPSGTVGRDTGSFGDGVGDDTRINLNTADAGQLSTLSGIGQSKAEAIVAYREEHGDFASIEEIMNVMGEREMNQYLYTKLVAGSLCTNDTLAFHEKRTQFDSIVKMSHLRAQVMQIYNQTKSYLKNPQPVSDNLLYGEFHENSKHTTRMPYMEAVYDVLEKNHGKVIYFDFWARWCPPCLTEMEPLKQLRSKFSTNDLIIYSICVSEPKEQWEECLNEYSLKNCGIECVHVTDYLGIDNYQKIRKQWKIDRIPYYILINRKGQIIDFGATARPSNPQLVSRIEDAVNSK